MNEEEEGPLDFEPDLPVEELERRLKMFVQETNEAEEKVAFYRSLLSEDEEKAFAAEHGPAEDSNLHEIDVCFEGEEAVLMIQARAKVEGIVGRAITDTEFLEYIITNYLK